jgi:predicted enzyme related to lactoylglutathione lyase
MTNPNFVLLYVADPIRSAVFYEPILKAKPVEKSPGYSMFVLDGRLKIGFWKRDEVQPEAEGAPGSMELVFAEASDAAVDERFAQWTGEGIVIAQKPTRMEFGYTFVGLDPDRHRLGVYKLGQ